MESSSLKKFIDKITIRTQIQIFMTDAVLRQSDPEFFDCRQEHQEYID